jgi:hypothetical protein
MEKSDDSEGQHPVTASADTMEGDTVVESASAPVNGVKYSVHDPALANSSEKSNGKENNDDNGGDGGWDELMGKDIQVRYLVRGVGDTAAFGAIVTCDYKTYMNDEKEPFETLTNQRFKVGEGDAFPGLELPLRHSRVGGRFIIKCTSKFAFGPTGRPPISGSTPKPVAQEIPAPQTGNEDIVAVPPDTNLIMEVEVTKHQLEESFEEGSREKTIFVLSVRKECGNR